MSIRGWTSLITAVFLVLIVFFARHEIEKAWMLLETVNLWILALLIPVQLIVYFAAAEMMFSYLRAKKSTDKISPLTEARMALEMNFVNHILPSAGVSGMSYMTWRLGGYGVAASRATVAQLQRYVIGFASFITLLLVSVIFVTIDGSINRVIILLSSLMVILMIVATMVLVILVSNKKRSEKFAAFAVRYTNKAIKIATFGRRKKTVKRRPIVKFFDEMHDEYVTLIKDRKILFKPFLWGLVFNGFDVLLFVVTFWALGSPVNPAPVLIAYGLASLAGSVVVTPGGAGAYEAVMVSFLATAGIMPGVAIAGILLTRIIVLLGTIGLGYVFYQHAIIRYGKPNTAL